MKNLILLIALFTTGSSFFAQNNTIGKTDTTASHQQNVVIIPFESKLYISDIDRDLSQKNDLTFYDIKAKFRASLDQNIYLKLRANYNPLSFYTIDPQEAKKELSYIYNSIGYKYDLMPEEEVVKKKFIGSNLINKFKKKPHNKKYIEGGIENGHIVSQVDNREKYMKTMISNENLIENLNKKYQSTYYIFINELDIKRGVHDMYASSSQQANREIKVHYTIFDNNGNVVSSGAVKSFFPSGQNDIDKIIKIHFPLIAESIVNKLNNENLTGSL